MHYYLKYFSFLSLFLVILISGCDNRLLKDEDERLDRHFRRGESLFQDERYDDALEAFNRVIDSHLKAPESHLNSGRIYLDYKKDPVMAEYHFRRFIEQDPDSDKAEIVKQLIETARKEYASQLPALPYGKEGGRHLLQKELDELKAEHFRTKQELAYYKSELQKRDEQIAELKMKVNQLIIKKPDSLKVAQSIKPEKVSYTEAHMADNHSTTYIVQSGDSLSSISRKVYGNSNQWRKIFEANRDQLKTENALKVGQELKIP